MGRLKCSNLLNSFFLLNMILIKHSWGENCSLIILWVDELFDSIMDWWPVLGVSVSCPAGTDFITPETLIRNKCHLMKNGWNKTETFPPGCCATMSPPDWVQDAGLRINGVNKKIWNYFVQTNTLFLMDRIIHEGWAGWLKSTYTQNLCTQWAYRQ